MGDTLPNGNRGLAEYPFHLTLWHGLALILGLALLGWGIWYYRKQRALRAAQKPKDPPLVVCQKQIEALTPALPFAKPEQVHYYYQLGLMFREFLEELYGFQATDLTLRELKKPLSRHISLGPQTLEEILQFFERSEMIKFSEDQASLEHAQRDHQNVCSWVRALMPSHTSQATSPASI